MEKQTQGLFAVSIWSALISTPSCTQERGFISKRTLRDLLPFSMVVTPRHLSVSLTSEPSSQCGFMASLNLTRDLPTILKQFFHLVQMGLPSHNYGIITIQAAVLCLTLGSSIWQWGMDALLQILTLLNTLWPAWKPASYLSAQNKKYFKKLKFGKWVLLVSLWWWTSVQWDLTEWKSH